MKPPSPHNRGSSVQRRSRKQEDRYAKRWHGKRQPGSGSRPGYRGDVKLEDFLTEVKFTDAKSCRLELDTLRKIGAEAAAIGRKPLLALDFMGVGNLNMNMDLGSVGASFVIMPRWVFEEITGIDKEERET